MDDHSFDKIDWKAAEDSKEIRRPFTVKIEESVARAFIAAVKSRGLFVRETMVKLMREFAEYGVLKEELKDEQRKGTGEVPTGSSDPDSSDGGSVGNSY
jgi:hypothetical protein